MVWFLNYYRENSIELETEMVAEGRCIIISPAARKKKKSQKKALKGI